MSRFNSQTTGTKTINLAGGKAYSQHANLELASIVLTSFGDDKFYQTSGEIFNRIKGLLAKVDPMFAAKLAIYARTKFGMRTVTHVLASLLAEPLSGKPYARSFYEKIIHRPDDMLEIRAYDKASGDGKMSNAMKAGFRKKLETFNEYTLAKYRGEGKSVKMVDVVNVCHPKSTEAITKLIKGELRSEDTWESQLSAVGSNPVLKAKVWKNLIESRKIGYFALLRNLRNIITQADTETVESAAKLLTDEKLIRNSLVMPFRFQTAYNELKKAQVHVPQIIFNAISEALDMSCANIPKLNGKTLIALDVSGSMMGKPSEIGSLFAAIMGKAFGAELMTFDSDATYVNLDYGNRALTLASQIPFRAGGTNFHSIFQKANKPYDRIIILSDMQGWMGYDTPMQSLHNYQVQYSANPFIYHFDLNGYGTMQFPIQRVAAIAGFSEKVFDIMGLIETDANAMLREIDKIEL
jgi:60 kDa SS-A/Ro ribonucleoprotein